MRRGLAEDAREGRAAAKRGRGHAHEFVIGWTVGFSHHRFSPFVRENPLKSGNKTSLQESSCIEYRTLKYWGWEMQFIFQNSL
jgi:hypothetical protein